MKTLIALGAAIIITTMILMVTMFVWVIAQMQAIQELQQPVAPTVELRATA